MQEITLQFKPDGFKNVEELMNHYKLSNVADLFAKSIGLLNVAAHVEKTNGIMFARKGENETKIITR